MPHTPGDWKLTQPAGGFASIVDANGELVFALAYPSLGLGDKARNPEEVEANAQLLVSAPKLLEALKELYAQVKGECPSLLNEDSGVDAELDSQIRAAIALAEPDSSGGSR